MYHLEEFSRHAGVNCRKTKCEMFGWRFLHGLVGGNGQQLLVGEPVFQTVDFTIVLL